MSIDYTASFGIGYEVVESDALEDNEELEDGLLEYLENNISDGFECFETGNAFTGDMDGIFLVIDNALGDGLDLSSKKAALDTEIERLELKACGEFDLVGGILVY